jgi:hypothetical protein
MGDTVFVNGRAVVHKGSAGKSIAFPDVCLCPPPPPTGPIPTPLPNTVQAIDLDGGATSVVTEGNPIGKQSSFFAKSTGNEVSRPTGGGVVTQGVQGKAYFQTSSPDVMIEGEPVVRHLDLLTHNHVAQVPGNTPPVPWLSTQSLPALPPPALRISPKDGPGLSLKITTATGIAVEDRSQVDISEAGSKAVPTTVASGAFDHKKPKGVVEVRFRELRRALWTKPKVKASEPVELAVLTGGYPDGTKVVFEIRRAANANAAAPLETLSATLKDSKARVAWKYVQALNGPAATAFVFRATIDDKRIQSGSLQVVAYPPSDVRGVKQWLCEHGYDAGPPDASEGGPFEAALKKFQGDHPPLEATGTLDETTRKVVAHFKRSRS